MLGRRVFASAPLPRHMWAKLHIQSAAQAKRLLPSLAPLTGSLCCGISGLGTLNRSTALLCSEEGPLSQVPLDSSWNMTTLCMEWGLFAYHVVNLPVQHLHLKSLLKRRDAEESI